MSEFSRALKKSDFENDPSFDTFKSQLTLIGIVQTPVIVPSEPASLVTQMKREVFGNTYDLKAQITESSLGCIITKTVEFTHGNGSVIIFNISYVKDDDSYSVISTDAFAVGEEPLLREYKSNVPWVMEDLSGPITNQGFTVQVDYIKLNVSYSILVKNIVGNSSTVAEATVTQRAITVIDTEEVLGLRYVYAGNQWNNVAKINVFSTTDFFFGRNLGQVGFVQLNSKDICLNENGQLQYNNLVRQREDYPPLTEVVDGKGSTLIEKVFYLANKDKPGMKKITFLSLLVSYAMLRYYLWFLMNCKKFDINILCKDRTIEFFEALNSSIYTQYNEVFFETDIKGFGAYFKSCGNCVN